MIRNVLERNLGSELGYWPAKPSYLAATLRVIDHLLDAAIVSFNQVAAACYRISMASSSKTAAKEITAQRTVLALLAR